MDRRHLLLPALLFGSGILLTHINVKADMVHGWELGARTGLMCQSDTLKITARDAAGDALNVERHLSDNGWLGGIFVGYNWKDNLTTLGVNLNLDWNSIDDVHGFTGRDSAGDNYAFRARYERDFFYGVSGRVGYRAWESITPFVKVGIERSTNRLHLTVDNSNVPAVPVRLLDSNISHHKTGYVLGFGLDIPVYNKNTNLRFEYNYHLCSSLGFNLGNTEVVGKADYSPKAHFFTLGFQWGQV